MISHWPKRRHPSECSCQIGSFAWYLDADHSRSCSNHASFYYAQLSAVQILLEDMTAAANTSRSYFAGPFKGQIEANGEQVSWLFDYGIASNGTY